MANITSKPVYVWIWLAGQQNPVPAGVLEQRTDAGLSFRYGNKYVERADAISIYRPELPLEAGIWFEPTEDLGMPGCIRDAAPDSWGRRVITSALTGQRGPSADVTALSETVYLLHSGSNRFGAIDFQESAETFIPRGNAANLDDLHKASQLVDEGETLPKDLADALVGGTTIGGARPKALLTSGNVQFLAKFSTSSDTFDVVGAEAASNVLAKACGIDVADSQLATSLGKKVLLTKRFDRPEEGVRRAVVSGLTMLGLGEMTARYGSYPDLLQVLKSQALQPEKLGEKLFRRIAFNIAISNTDDHLRNHAAFWDGANLELTPAFDLSPMNRVGEEAAQAIAYSANGNRQSNLASLVASHHEYDLSQNQAKTLISNLVETINDKWESAADEAQLTLQSRQYLWHRQFLNRGIFNSL